MQIEDKYSHSYTSLNQLTSYYRIRGIIGESNNWRIDLKVKLARGGIECCMMHGKVHAYA